MKRILRNMVLCLTFFFSVPLFGQQVSSATIQFIKGNISDKTAAVRLSSGSDSDSLAEAGLDFSIKNRNFLGDDRELSALAVASVLALPKDATNLSITRCTELSQKIITLFNLFTDENVRIAVIERLVPFSIKTSDGKAVELINEFLKGAIASNTSASGVCRSSIIGLGTIGNSDSFSIIYNCWKSKIWPQYNSEIEQSLVKLSELHTADAIKILLSSSPSDNYAFFSLILNNQNISNEFKSEMAENALSFAIQSMGDLSNSSTAIVNLQLDSLRVILNNNWTRAAPLVIRYFALAKEEYAAKVLTEQQFVNVIQYTAGMASSETATTLSEYLTELNQNAEKNSIPSKPVVLAVISALGTLGDKVAFDNLLYVTYLNYPEDVIAAARDSLAKLKW